MNVRASSTWQHDTRKFGPQHALDSQSMDAWKSAPSEGSNPMAYYEIHFRRLVLVREIRVQFQGGFVGMDCIVYKKKRLHNNNDSDQSDNDEEWEELEEIFMDPRETNEVQIFHADEDMISNEKNPCTALRIEFGKGTDFYGRIVIYSLEVWGLELSDE